MSFSKKCLPILLSACLLALPACGNAEQSAPEPSAPESSAPAESSASQEASQAESGAAAAVPSFTFTGEELLPGGKPAMDEGAQPAVFYYDEEFSLQATYPEARCRDLSGVDFSASPDKLLYTTFDSKTVWPDNLPEGFDPQQILDRNRNPGLGVRSLHEQGITGKGVNIGIIDDSLLTDHVEHKDRLKMYKNFGTSEYAMEASMHGLAVASIALGSTVGVAPEANLYYAAYDFQKALGENGESLAPFIEGLTYLLDLNELLPEEDKLDVISISKGWTAGVEEGVEEMDALVERAAEEGILVVTCAIESMEEQCGFSLNGASRDPLSDPDDRSVYCVGRYSSTSNGLAAPMDFRGFAAPTGPEDYVSYADGGLSWTAPYVAGVYALAKQVKPEITPEEFCRLAMETSSSIRHETQQIGGKPTVSILYNLIDPPALIAALEQE